MNILITGSAGFIGFHLALKLLKNKYTIIGLDNLNSYYSKDFKKHRISILNKKKNFFFEKIDLKSKIAVNKLFKKYRPEVVFHLASQPGIMYSYKNPKSYFLNNVDATINLMQVAHRNHVKKFYFTSSSSVYGNKKKFPIKENQTLKPLNTYAKTKKKCEIILQKFFKNTNIDLKIFRPFTVYGTFSRPDMIFITYLKKTYKNEKFYLYNNGEYIRDFTYVDDLCEILKRFIKIGKIKNNILNICSSKPIKIKNVLPIIDKYNLKKSKVEKKPLRKGEMIKTYGNNYLLKKYVKFKKFTSIEAGVKKTVRWYINFKQKQILQFRKVKY